MGRYLRNIADRPLVVVTRHARRQRSDRRWPIPNLRATLAGQWCRALQDLGTLPCRSIVSVGHRGCVEEVARRSRRYGLRFGRAWLPWALGDLQWRL